MPKQMSMLLRCDGLAELVGLVVLYALTGASWWLFAGLFLVPDIGMLGYLAGPRVGAVTYNALHLLAPPVALGLAALASGWGLGVSVALVWAAHIQFDRAAGYGLKYATAFADTHLGRIGQAA
jgi:hypothetical protein